MIRVPITMASEHYPRAYALETIRVLSPYESGFELLELYPIDGPGVIKRPISVALRLRLVARCTHYY